MRRHDPSQKKSQGKKIYSRQLLRDTDKCTQGRKELEIKVRQAHKHTIIEPNMGSVSLLWLGGFTCSDSLQVSYSSCRCHWSSPLACALQGGFGERCLTSKCIIGSQSVQTAAAFTTSPFRPVFTWDWDCLHNRNWYTGKKRAFPEYHQQHQDSSNCFLIVPKPGEKIITRFSYSKSPSSGLQASNVVSQSPWTQKA